ncbi:hypothetical protein IW261DRAFT_1456012 [Armillaria novae-zelandiae]|uniref:Uncharacterized protein n=1 Tax=Armillaria novae-zelandiae TaxID=153914 RepID=A0AA39PN06_9AGAR|nr:hypothetical protein IW261DRAFT_1456012 [Armillaria novae-zelandiae]
MIRIMVQYVKIETHLRSLSYHKRRIVLTRHPYLNLFLSSLFPILSDIFFFLSLLFEILGSTPRCSTLCGLYPLGGLSIFITYATFAFVLFCDGINGSRANRKNIARSRT